METITVQEAKAKMLAAEFSGLSYETGGIVLARYGTKFALMAGLGQAKLTEAELDECLSRTVELRTGGLGLTPTAYTIKH